MLRRTAAQLWAQGVHGAAGVGGLPRGPAAAAAAASLGGSSGQAALSLARPFSGSAKETLSEAAHRLRSIAERSAGAIKAAGSAAARAPDALYRALPTSAQQLVNAAQVMRWGMRLTAPLDAFGSRTVCLQPPPQLLQSLDMSKRTCHRPTCNCRRPAQ